MFYIECIVKRMHALFALHALLFVLTGVGVLRIPVLTVRTTFVQHLSPQINFPCLVDPCPQSLELESWRKGGHPDRSQDPECYLRPF